MFGWEDHILLGGHLFFLDSSLGQGLHGEKQKSRSKPSIMLAVHLTAKGVCIGTKNPWPKVYHLPASQVLKVYALRAGLLLPNSSSLGRKAWVKALPFTFLL